MTTFIWISARVAYRLLAACIWLFWLCVWTLVARKMRSISRYMYIRYLVYNISYGMDVAIWMAAPDKFNKRHTNLSSIICVHYNRYVFAIMCRTWIWFGPDIIWHNVMAGTSSSNCFLHTHVQYMHVLISSVYLAECVCVCMCTYMYG